MFLLFKKQPKCRWSVIRETRAISMFLDLEVHRSVPALQLAGNPYLPTVGQSCGMLLGKSA
jgi:hypothetical protein